MKNQKNVHTLYKYIKSEELQKLCEYFSSSFDSHSCIISSSDFTVLVASGNMDLNFLKNENKTINFSTRLPTTLWENTLLVLPNKYLVYEEKDRMGTVAIPIELKGNTIAYFCFIDKFTSASEPISFINFLFKSFEKIEYQKQLLEKMKDQEEREKNELKTSEERFRLVLEGSQLGFWDWHIITGEVIRNERWATMLGYTFEDIKNTTYQWEDFLHPDDRSKAWDSINNHLNGSTDIHEMEYRMLTKDGEYKWIFDRAMVTERDLNGKPTRMSGTHLDISERKNKEKELLYWASHDKLTNLYNRNFLDNEIIRINETNAFPLVIMIVDIDNLKKVNDSYGHFVGDDLIKRTSQLLLRAIGEKSIICRTGGDEFTILVYEESIGDLEFYMNEIRNLEKEDKNFIPVRISVGFSRVESSSDFDEAIKKADELMYLDKKNRKEKD